MFNYSTTLSFSSSDLSVIIHILYYFVEYYYVHIYRSVRKVGWVRQIRADFKE